jgi:hypothetical protein
VRFWPIVVDVGDKLTEPDRDMVIEQMLPQEVRQGDFLDSGRDFGDDKGLSVQK